MPSGCRAPENAARYKEAGINLYVGLWNGPNEAQIKELKAAGMPVICDQNRFALGHLDDPTFAAWMHGDEPDNAQALPNDRGYGPPIKPSLIVADYEELRAKDPSRPVLLNLGQGVANDAWKGRGPGASLDDYPQYVKGADIVSFDVYPVAGTDSPEKLWLVPFGIERLQKWTGGGKVLWNCVECTRISNLEMKPTPAQVKAEVWMAIAQGSQGLIYFVHQFKPRFIEYALLEDPEMLAEVTAINQRVQALAPVLNSPMLEGCRHRFLVRPRGPHGAARASARRSYLRDRRQPAKHAHSRHAPVGGNGRERHGRSGRRSPRARDKRRPLRRRLRPVRDPRLPRQALALIPSALAMTSRRHAR